MINRTARRKGQKFVTLTLTFQDMNDLQKFAIDALGPDAWVYLGDQDDREFAGDVPPAGAYVIRKRGEKPDEMMG